tara:strand:+ start:952 stop:1395 length:444 start_codon:yes stop_codon:yes gene_type:complete
MIEEKIKIVDRVGKILKSREWTFADLTNIKDLVKLFSENIYNELGAKEKLHLVWEKNISRDEMMVDSDGYNIKNTNKLVFGSFFQKLVTEEIQLQVANTLQEQLLNANINFGSNKNKEDETNEISERSLVRKSHKGSKAVSKKNSNK